ncbi:MAG: pentapeptide repeat-containing protein [Acidimicrobiales bacterium]
MLSLAGVALLLALALTGVVPASAASCVPGPNAMLSGCNLSKANLYGANLTGANLTKANLTGANLTNANLTRANLTKVTATGADLQGALVSDATLTEAGMKNTLLDEATLTGSTLTGATFSGSDVTGLVSGTDKGSGTLPTNWKLVSGYLVGPGANLTDAVLTGTKLTGAKLTGANLTGANLTGASLTSAALSGVISGGLVGTPSGLPANWSVVSGYLVGPGAFLYGASLGDAHLTGADAAGANLEGAVLTGATLTDANLSNTDALDVTLSASDLSGTNLAGAALVGVRSGGITGTPKALPSGWELVDGVLKMTSTPAAASSASSGTRTSSAAPVSRVEKAPPVKSTPRVAPALQLGIDVYVTGSCEPAAAWQANAMNEMKGIKSLGANSVEIVFPFYALGPTTNSVFAADLCGEPEAIPVPLQSPSPARLAVLVHAAESAGLHVLLRPLLDQSNLWIFGNWRGNITPTNGAAWITSYESMLKPYLQMAQANKVTRFAISSELTSMATSSQWPSAIASAKKLYSGQLVFDSIWAEPQKGAVHAGTAVAQDAYPHVSHTTPTSSVAQLLAGWNTYLKGEAFAAAAADDTFEEVGIPALDGSYADPNVDPSPGETFNQTIQANWFTAACQFVKERKIAGLYFWGPWLYYNSGKLMTKPDPTQPSELQPAAQAAIRKCFA